ncbi:MAG TPA: trehalase family glycosidase [Thermoflexus sp.]|nr:trehalase family glycosidase [Thermoflexus sp.]
MNDLRKAAVDVLHRNDRGTFTAPSPRQYPHLWLWDAGFAALGWAAIGDFERAYREIRAALRGQWHNGMIPHVVFYGWPSAYFPGADVWRSDLAPEAPKDLPTSGITQPPVLAFVVEILFRHDPDRQRAEAFARETFPALRAYHRWLHAARDPEGVGLSCIVHPWESGMDNSPLWDQPLSRVPTEGLPPYQRADHHWVPEEQRPRAIDYDRFLALILHLRAHRYGESGVRTSPFRVVDVLFNALRHRSEEALYAMAQALGEPTEEIEGWLERSRTAFQTRLWDPERGFFLDWDDLAGERIPVIAAGGFVALYAGLATPEQAREMVDRYLRNPEAFAPDGGTRYLVPTVSKGDPGWEARRYWRGPIWINLNALIAHGLARYGFHGLAEEIRHHTLDLIARSGFHEYYDPRTGEGLGIGNFTWSAALLLGWELLKVEFL